MLNSGGSIYKSIQDPPPLDLHDLKTNNCKIPVALATCVLNREHVIQGGGSID